MSKPQNRLFISIDTTKHSSSIKKNAAYLYLGDITFDELSRLVNELRSFERCRYISIDNNMRFIF